MESNKGKKKARRKIIFDGMELDKDVAPATNLGETMPLRGRQRCYKIMSNDEPQNNPTVVEAPHARNMCKQTRPTIVEGTNESSHIVNQTRQNKRRRSNVTDNRELTENSENQSLPIRSRQRCFKILYAPEASADSQSQSATSPSEGTEQNKRKKRAARKGKQAHSESQLAYQQQSESSRRSKKCRKKPNQKPRVPAALQENGAPKSPSRLAKCRICQFCGAKLFQYETDNFCCQKGKIEIATNPAPVELMRLLTSKDEDAVHFRRFARMYNNLFAFSSIGGNHDGRSVRGIYVFKLQGQLYHYVPDLIPSDGEPPKYLQLYFYDPQHELQDRAGVYEELRADVVAQLMHIVEKNPYTNFFRSLRDLVIDETTTITINQNSIRDQRTYNAPSSDEVAGIWVDSPQPDAGHGPHILVYGKSNRSHRIRHYYGCYDPLQYPLIFPLGDCGWHPGLRKVAADVREFVYETIPNGSSHCNQTREEKEEEEEEEALLIQNPSGQDPDGQITGKRISCRQYYAYKLQIRAEDLSYLLKMGRLLQQYIVDMYVKLENTRLDFLRKNQQQIRAELYQGILDSIDQGQTTGQGIGHRVILPPSFTGGPRDMRRRFLNAISLVQKYGKPDLFLTMTCNPKWPEIQDELEEYEKAENRPDLIARVFHSKLAHLSKQLMKREIFGKVAAKIQVVEFQKRGLPHAHILVILDKQWKIKKPEDFDKYVTAEVPSTDNIYLRTLVLNHMMHGPCGPDFPNCACMEEKGRQKVCRFNFPKEFAEHTTTNAESYPIYRRRNTGEQIQMRGSLLDNRWVTPYNPYLLGMFDCHINVEICSTIKAVKYLYKYVYKGHDKVSFRLSSTNNDLTHDEIECYQSARWISPPEAAWRIFGFDLYTMHPPVVPLPVHTPGMQNIQFSGEEILEEIAQDELRTRTMLLAFFEKNCTLPTDQKLLYREFPEHFVWKAKKKKWKKRKRGIAIGRIAYAGPSEGERFYLRLLLANIRGPTSFKDLLTVNGRVCSSFQEAAIEHRLLESEKCVEMCMDEGVAVQMPIALRRLFATLLIFSEPARTEELWSKYYEHLSEDFRYNAGHNEEPWILHQTVTAVQGCLEGMGKSLADYNLSDLLEKAGCIIDWTKDVRDALTAPIPEDLIHARKKLNCAQKIAYKEIIQHVKQEKAGAFFIDGPGGTGKTFLYSALYARVRQLGKIVLPTASSGIAAANIPTGRTAHSRFKLPIDHDVSMTCKVGKQSSLAALLKESSLIIWDEASMAHRHNIEALDLLLKDLCSSDELFGGKIVVFGGDFRQVLPVLPRKTQAEAVDASLVSSTIWPKLKRFSLTENMRAKEDPQFSNFLLDLGNGKLQTQSSAQIRLPPNLMLCLKSIDEQFSEILPIMLPEYQQLDINPEIYSKKAILAPRNDEVDAINEQIIVQFPGNATIYKSFDSIDGEDAANYPQEFLHTLCPPGISPHELRLKPNCPVILLRNLDPSSGLCNGTRLICKAFFPNLIQCTIASGHYKGQVVLLPRISLKPSASSHFPIQFQRRQFPIKLSFAMTINKSQGQTLNQVGIHLKEPCFSHGQLYVAMSRAQKSENLSIFCNDDDCTADADERGSLQNVIAFEVLCRANILQK